jgi:hypothetical protein
MYISPFNFLGRQNNPATCGSCFASEAASFYNGIFLFGTSPYITKWVKPLAVFAHLRWYDMTLAFAFFLALFLGLFKFLHLL